MDALKNYIDSINKNLSTHDAGEGSHYAALKTLIQSLDKKVFAQVLPSHIKEGAPDLKVSRGTTITIGYIEAKYIGLDLKATEKSNQLKRYLTLPNLILTDFLEFRWYAEGKMIKKSCIGALINNKIKVDANGIQETILLFGEFLNYRGKLADTPKELAQHMARLAHFIREEIVTALASTSPGSLLSQLSAFRESLIPNLNEVKFADMYAQTITYGLFAGRCSDPTNTSFSRLQAAELIPKTNTFLRKTFQHIAVDLDKRVAFWVDELVELLLLSDIDAILKDFGKSITVKDPIVHFYETFLAEYDPKLKKSRGVYFTPEPVVSYIVSSINCLLKTRFNKPQGLADNSVFILDPAVGTATFLYTVIREIFESQQKAGQQGYWDNYVSQNLLKRIFGFELLMAPYAVAHLKLGLLLKETGYKFQTDERLGVYLTNTLEESFKKPEQLSGFNQYIVEEANAAAEVKKDKSVMVVLGNPPYSISSVNRSEWINRLIDDYKAGLDEKKLNLDDDYIKFIRFAQWRIEQTGYGILGFITNNSYLDGLTHRRMRESLLKSFSNIYILNLHGDSRRGEQSPDNTKDKNVFDIQQGVAIGIFVKEPGDSMETLIHYNDIWGLREKKYRELSEADIDSFSWQQFTPEPPYFLFIKSKSTTEKKEYDNCWSIKHIFTVNNDGIQTKRDNLTIHFTEQELLSTVQDVKNMDADTLRQKYSLPEDGRDWTVDWAKHDITYNQGVSSPIAYRPFDNRYTYYTGKSRGFLGYPRAIISDHLVTKRTIALATNRFVKLNHITHFFVARSLVDTHFLETANSCLNISPLYLCSSNQLNIGEGRQANLSINFTNTISDILKLKFMDEGKGDFNETFGAEDIFNYMYAIFYSPTYRIRYAEFLKMEFPRLPLTSDKALFKALADKGDQLVALHLMESPILDAEYQRIGYPVNGSHFVEKVTYTEKTMRVYINKEQYFEGVEPGVWNFEIGGYQVCDKWLKYRKNRPPLNPNDINHFQKMVIALRKTTRLMTEIDTLIPDWPLK